MPNKTLTLHKQTNGQDWFSRGTEYGKKEIEGIDDGVGGNTKHPPTSIPSPFARFDLVRTAFQRLSSNPQLKGEPNDERLVSECFDVSQLFFHFDKYKEQLEIIRWNKEDDLKVLLQSRSVGHNRLGKVLDLFLKQDGEVAKDKNGYNFHKLKNLFILRYNGSGRSVILGGTSSSTLFFSSPEDLSFISDLRFGNYKPFTRQFCPLHQRNDPEFQKFWYGLLRQPDFSTYFPEVAAYLRRSLQLLQDYDNKIWQEIGTDAVKLDEEYSKLFEDLVSPAGYLVEVLDDFRIKKAKVNESLLANSEFILHSQKFASKYPEARKPMILQNNYQGKLRYTRDIWDPTVEVKPYDPNDWRNNKRKLPGQADYYPYLTISDFLEPYIIRLVYPINSAAFYDGGYSSSDITKGYLLPLTETFFDFFDVDDLFAGHKVRIDFQRLGADSVKVSLSITLKNNELPIKFERIYQGLGISEIHQEADESQNKGAVVECQVGVSLMPFIRIDSPTFKPLYHVQVADRDISYFTIGNEYQLQFRDRENNKITAVDGPRERSRKQHQQLSRDAVTTNYYRISQNFEYTILEVAGKRGIIIPRFDKVSKPMGNDKFTFAVDFGTTNTHIEFKTNRNTIEQPFTLSSNEKLIVTLYDSAFLAKDRSLNSTGADILAKIWPLEWIPEHIGKFERAAFPTRTALLENRPNWNQNVYALSDFNPALLYEKQNIDDKIYHIETNLKWVNYTQDDHEEKRIIGYIESLLLLIRNKILLNNGNLDATELIWFYPLSMLETRRNFFQEHWTTLYRQWITDKNYPQRIPESTAPYYWYQKGSGTHEISSASRPAVSIDIGGGTSDVVVFQDDKPTLITSFRFAANSVFGDAFAKEGAASRNGFVRRYEKKIRELLEANNFTDLAKALEFIRDRQRSEDIVAFFFSLKDNQEVQKVVSIDFNEMLAKDETFKIVFLIFYTAIIYHVAKLMRVKKAEMPRYIAFSGNGSKVLRILSTNPSVLSKLAQLMFEEIYEVEKYPVKLDIILEQVSPKEATCKGGLKRSKELHFDLQNTEDDEVIEEIKAVLIGTTDDQIGKRKDTYEKINDTVINSVADEVRKYIDILFRLDEKISLRDKLGIKPSHLDIYKEVLLDDLNQNVKVGFANKRAESDVKDSIEETMFFYPLIKGINALAYSVTK